MVLVLGQVMNWENCQGSGPQLTELPYWYRSSIEGTAMVQVLKKQIYETGASHWLREIPEFKSLTNTTAKPTHHRLRELPRFRSSIDRTAILVQVIDWRNCQGSGPQQTWQQCWYRPWIERTAEVQVLNWQNCHTGTGHWLKELPRFRSSIDRCHIDTVHWSRELPRFRALIDRTAKLLIKILVLHHSFFCRLILNPFGSAAVTLKGVSVILAAYAFHFRCICC